MISTRKHRITRPSDPKVVAEVHIGWCPNSKGTPWRRRLRHWRWDVTYYRTASTRFAAGAVGSTSSVVSGGGGGSGSTLGGVYDVRIHLGANFGYTLTRRAAWRRVRESITNYPHPVG